MPVLLLGKIRSSLDVKSYQWLRSFKLRSNEAHVHVALVEVPEVFVAETLTVKEGSSLDFVVVDVDLVVTVLENDVACEVVVEVGCDGGVGEVEDNESGVVDVKSYGARKKDGVVYGFAFERTWLRERESKVK